MGELETLVLLKGRRRHLLADAVWEDFELYRAGWDNRAALLEGYQALKSAYGLGVPIRFIISKELERYE